MIDTNTSNRNYINLPFRRFGNVETSNLRYKVCPSPGTKPGLSKEVSYVLVNSISEFTTRQKNSLDSVVYVRDKGSIKMTKSKGQMGLSHPDNCPSTSPTTTNGRELTANKATLFENVDNCSKKIISKKQAALKIITRAKARETGNTVVKAKAISKTWIGQTPEEFRGQNEMSILSRIIQYEMELGMAPQSLDLLCRFSRAELDAVYVDLMWLYGHDLFSSAKTTVPDREMAVA